MGRARAPRQVVAPSATTGVGVRATADLSAALSDALEATSAEEFQTAVSEVEATGEAAATALGDLTSSIEALDIPDDAADAVASYTQALADQAEIAQQIAGSDMTSAAAIEDTLAGAQEANRSARRALRAAADELGVSACAPSAADAGATTTTAAN